MKQKSSAIQILNFVRKALTADSLYRASLAAQIRSGDQQACVIAPIAACASCEGMSMRRLHPRRRTLVLSVACGGPKQPADRFPHHRAAECQSCKSIFVSGQTNRSHEQPLSIVTDNAESDAEVIREISQARTRPCVPTCRPPDQRNRGSTPRPGRSDHLTRWQVRPTPRSPSFARGQR